MARPADRIKTALSKHGYAQIKKVGEGSFGAAILVQHEKDKDTKAIVKMIDISRASKSEKDDALKESKVLSSLKHPYIVRYRESFHEDGWLCIAMDFCEGGDLSDRIKKMRQSGKHFPEEQVLRWFTQAVLALKYIHDLHILHRDLKSGNFFLSKSGNIKMGDFGIAKVLECTAACAQTQIGTPYYLSPEICQGKPYAWGSDIWSMGCILYEMCACKVPFDAPDLKSLIQRITKGPTPDLSNEYSLGLRNLCKELLDRDPAKRPPAPEVLKKPVVKETVKKMLEQINDEEEASASSVPVAKISGASKSAASEPPKAAASGGKYAVNAGTYCKADSVQYYSETHAEWLPATITNVDADGRIMLNVKPNVWISLEVQGAKVRPKEASNAPVEQAAAAEGLPPRPRGSGGPGAPNPAVDRNGAAGRNGSRDRPLARQNSQDRGGQRQPSPGVGRGGPPSRGPSQEGGQRQRTPGRQAPSPGRRT